MFLKIGYLLTLITQPYQYSLTKNILYQTDLSNLPKTLISIAELDALNEEGTLYFEKLQNTNVPCEIRHIKGVLHGFFHYYEPKMNAFKEAVYFLIEFLRNLE